MNNQYIKIVVYFVLFMSFNICTGYPVAAIARHYGASMFTTLMLISIINSFMFTITFWMSKDYWK